MKLMTHLHMSAAMRILNQQYMASNSTKCTRARDPKKTFLPHILINVVSHIYFDSHLKYMALMSEEP